MKLEIKRAFLFFFVGGTLGTVSVAWNCGSRQRIIFVRTPVNNYLPAVSGDNGSF